MDFADADITKFVEDVAVGKSVKVEKTKKKRGKSIVGGGLGAALRTAGLVGGILTYAVSQGLKSCTRNPQARRWGKEAAFEC